MPQSKKTLVLEATPKQDRYSDIATVMSKN